MRVLAGLFDTPVAVRKLIEELSAEGFNPELVSVFTNSPRTGTGVRTGETSEDVLAPPADIPAPDMRTNMDGQPVQPIPATPINSGLEPVVPDDRLPAAGPEQEIKTGIGAIPGGLHKALGDWGFANTDIRQYENALGQGRVLAVVELTDDEMAGRAASTMRRFGVTHLVFRDRPAAAV